LFVLAWFTKQTYVAAPAACLLAAFICRRAQAVRLFAFTVLLGCAGLAALAVPTHGDALLNLFLYNDNPFSVLNMLGIVQLNLATMVPLAAIAFAVPFSIAARVASWAPLLRRASVRGWLERSPTRRIMALSSLHMLFAFAVSFTSGKKGSNYNYFLEWNLACCVLVGLVTLFVLRGLGTKAISAPQLAILLVLLLFATSGPAALAERLRPTPPSTHGQDSERAMAFLRSLAGPVYSENMTILLRTGKEVITALSQRGRWDEQPFVDQLASGFFSAVIVTTSLDNRNRFSPAVQAAIEKAYTLRYNYGEFHIFLPKLT